MCFLNPLPTTMTHTTAAFASETSSRPMILFDYDVIIIIYVLVLDYSGCNNQSCVCFGLFAVDRFNFDENGAHVILDPQMHPSVILSPTIVDINS